MKFTRITQLIRRLIILASWIAFSVSWVVYIEITIQFLDMYPWAVAFLVITLPMAYFSFGISATWAYWPCMFPVDPKDADDVQNIANGDTGHNSANPQPNIFQMLYFLVKKLFASSYTLPVRLGILNTLFDLLSLTIKFLVVVIVLTSDQFGPRRGACV